MRKITGKCEQGNNWLREKEGEERERWNIAEKRVGIARKFDCGTVSTLSTCPLKTLLRVLATKS